MITKSKELRTFYLESHRSVLGSYLYVGMKVISPSMKSVNALFVCLWMFSCDSEPQQSEMDRFVVMRDSKLHHD